MNHHIMGLNWCSIGIEDVGGVGGKEDLTYDGASVFSFIFRNSENNRMYIGYVLMNEKYGMRFMAE